MSSWDFLSQETEQYVVKTHIFHVLAETTSEPNWLMRRSCLKLSKYDMGMEKWDH